MIDNIKQTMALMTKMQVAVPIEAFASKALLEVLQEQSDKIVPRDCRVTEVRYMNDEGGISCHLDFASDDMNNVYVVSITHLRFDRRHPLTREIEAYCKHRIKRLKKINRGQPPM